MSKNPGGPFPPHVLREYAFLADGERGVIVGPRGEIAWLCVPRWDSDAVFAGLIGGGGAYAVTPADRFVWGGYYEPGTLIWRSRWITDGGVVECREALAYPGESRRAVLLRRVIAVRGDARVQVYLAARAGYGVAAMSGLARQDGIWTGTTGPLRLRWQGGGGARVSPGRAYRHLAVDLTIPAGRHHDLVLELCEGALPDDPPDPDAAWQATEAAWKEAVPRLDQCLQPTQARHSYAVLRGLTGSAGGMVAAATTSLPERAETGRNYDYRYVWIRDQCFAGHAVAAVGDERLLADAVRFVAERLLDHGDRLAPAYTVDGCPVPDQRQLGLPGYPGGFDRIGNWVNKQFQLDAFGESLLLFAEAARFELLDAASWRAAETAAAAIAARWREPDAGIWELENRPWTHSRLIAAAGLRAYCSAPSLPRPRADLLTLADQITADTAKNAMHADGHWQRSPEDPGLDGSLLLVPLRGGVPASDPRTTATLAAYRRDLTVDGYAYRFRHDDRPLPDAEGSFTLCGFLMAMALLQQEERVEARAWWERNAAACGPGVLYAEEYDTTEHQLRGNLPQAFVHAVMLEAAARLA